MPDAIERLRAKWPGKSFWSPALGKQGGAALLLSDKSRFEVSEPSSTQAIPPVPVPPDPDPPDAIPADVCMPAINVDDDDNDNTPMDDDTARPDDSSASTVESHLSANPSALRSSRVPKKKRLVPLNTNTGPPLRKSTTPALPSNRKCSTKSKT